MLAFRKRMPHLLFALLLIVGGLIATASPEAAAFQPARGSAPVRGWVPSLRSWEVASLDLAAMAAPDVRPDGDRAGCISTICIPPVDVLRYSGWLQDRMPLNGSAEARLVALGQRLPCHRQLALLVLDRAYWRYDGFYGYFLFQSADLAPEIAEAMGTAGLARYQTVFEEAVALFGRAYPRSDLERQSHSGNLNSPHGRPSDLDIALRKLAQIFGSLDDYDGAVDAVIARDDCFSGVVDRARAGMSLYERLDYFVDTIAETLGPPADAPNFAGEVERLPDFFRGVYLASRPLKSPDGLSGLFRGDEGALAADIALALNMLELPEQSALIREAMTVFPAPYPVSTRTRQDYLLNPNTSLVARGRLFALDARIDRVAIIDALACVSEEAGLLPR